MADGEDEEKGGIMKSYELKPTDENLIDTYASDSIGRNSDLHKFLDILDSINENCSIAVDAQWGQGKTFFVKQAKLILDSFNEFSNLIDYDKKHRIKKIWSLHPSTELNRTLIPQYTVYFDAWENDNDEDPLLSLIYSIYTSIQTDYSFKEEINYADILSGIFELVTSKNIKWIFEQIQKKDILQPIRYQKELLDKINEFFSAIFKEQGNRLVIFIDELDRCKPDFAVKLLERIKHYFVNPDITFVFSINSMELQHTIKQYYGSEFDACKYLDRFFDLRIVLPDISTEKFLSSLGIEERYNYLDVIMRKVINIYSFSMREICKYIKMCNIAIGDGTNNNSDTSFFINSILVPLIIGLYIQNVTIYRLFVSGKDSLPLKQLINSVTTDGRFKKILFSGKELMGKGHDDIPQAEIDKRIEEIYNAVFNYEFNKEPYITVGRFAIRRETKDLVKRVAGMLSIIANVNI